MITNKSLKTWINTKISVEFTEFTFEITKDKADLLP
jgi:hypothetical protein